MNNFHGSLGSLTFPTSSSLTALMLNGNQLEGPLPPSLINCTDLEILDIGNNMINDTFPYSLEDLENLRVIILRSNRFHGPINNSSATFPFPKLRILDLSHNQFTGPLPINYFNNFVAMMPSSMDNVGFRYMFNSEFEYYSVTLSIKGGEMEMERILTIFTTIDLSDNLFRGPIPEVIGKLQSLKLLNFSHNSLTGDIPSSLSNLTQLEALDLSYKQLVGNIPMQLTSLTFLSVLNLSYNQLVGPIPQGKQFDTFLNDSFIGNLGLCGSTLSKKCSNEEPNQPTSVILEENNASSWFDWKIALMGYGCGLVLGISIGYIVFSTGKPQWFVRLIEREGPKKVRRLNRGSRGRRN
ncbi:receptor-like protein 54 [Pistacia vera]|uniref:receptor-like protein 54 n=1 Tax=Pistacia vera TaxID=55513 RepID=UPI0012632A3A|nr:receptor-like protein 54 [Pistacia vera]